MNKQPLWKLCLIIVTGLVAFFYILSVLTSRTEDGMSFIAKQDRDQLKEWGKEAERLYLLDDHQALNRWLAALKKQENTWLAVASFDIKHIAGEQLEGRILDGQHFGRNVDWKIHLYFESNPDMELRFTKANASFLIKLPDRMRPGTYWLTTRITMQILLPLAILILLATLLYRHIITPLQQLDHAASAFSKGDFDVRVRKLLGNRDDELSHLASTFDQMAMRIGELISNQRQLISDLSHELRTPLTRLDIAVNNFESKRSSHHLDRIARESNHIRKLVEDTLTLAWLENEKPIIQQENVNLVDLLDVVINDAKFEFSDRELKFTSPNNAMINNSSHKALCPALENIIRNALRYTPKNKTVAVSLNRHENNYCIRIIDQGPGIPEQYLGKVFNPFFRVDNSRIAENDSFGLGLALAKRHLNSVRASVIAKNQKEGGLMVMVMIPIT
jgi:two-component system sensor histidine kinase PfeS